MGWIISGAIVFLWCVDVLGAMNLSTDMPDVLAGNQKAFARHRRVAWRLIIINATVIGSVIIIYVKN